LESAHGVIDWQSGDVESLVQVTSAVHTVTCVLIDECKSIFDKMPNVWIDCFSLAAFIALAAS
jgi:hypothetical protein